MKKKILLIICYIDIALMILNYTILVLNMNTSIDVNMISMISFCLSPIIIFIWIYSLYIWSKYDNNPKNLLLLFILIGIYNPIFLIRKIKTNTIA